jgi:hypothetical protein
VDADDPRWQLRPEQIFDGRYSTNGEQLFELGIFNAGGNYGADDRIAPATRMVEWRSRRGCAFVGGARVERSELTLATRTCSARARRREPSPTPTCCRPPLNIDLTETQKLRLSASQTLARPEYREIAPICYRAGLGEEQRCGNPDLVAR